MITSGTHYVLTGCRERCQVCRFRELGGVQIVHCRTRKDSTSKARPSIAETRSRAETLWVQRPPVGYMV